MRKLFQPFPAMAVIFAASAAMLLGALAFQYIGGLQPCILCYYQRVPYAIILAAGIFYVLFYLWAHEVVPEDYWDENVQQKLNNVLRGLFLPAAAVFAAGCGLAAYHVGVEYHWWAGPDVCALPGQGTPDDLNALFNQIMSTPIVHCDEVQWSLFGISMAGYNGVISLGLCVFSVMAWARGRRNG